MRMVRSSSRREYRDSVISSDAGEISPKAWEKFIRNKIRTSFGVEDEVNQYVWIFVWHWANIDILNKPVCDGCHNIEGAVLNRDSYHSPSVSRHFHAGLSHSAPSGLGWCDSTSQ
jgi:hypothetical protein